MNFFEFISVICIFLIFHPPSVLTQQPYTKKSSTSCSKTDNSSSVLGYTCNGLHKNCQAYLTFRAQPPYNSISTISTLLSINPSKLSHLNSVSENQTFLTNQIVLVPITCSCSGHRYQANTSYVVEHYNTHLLIANNTFQGLTTCQALRGQNGNFTRNLYSGTRIRVPLRCACPTKNQSDNGVKYLLTYIVTWKDSVSKISRLFGVDTWKSLAANELSEQDFNIYPFTTLLVPLREPPSISRVRSLPPPVTPSSAAPPPSVPPPSGGAAKTWIYGVAGGLVGIFFLMGGIFVILFFAEQKRKDQLVIISSSNLESVPKENSQDYSFLESISRIVDENLKVYTMEEIKAATEDFSSGCWIKGSVYRATFNGDYAAIKKTNGSDVTKEISLLSKINHFNLIRLSGVCFDRGHWFLVYEYAANGALSDWIHSSGEEEKILSWSGRLKIALDVATGLNYLHNYTSPPYVHKDLNSSNVLLDQNFRAKITNLGLARSAEGQNGHFSLTRHIVGTRGYMAPEYLEHGLVSPKLDVYAFGVLMMEIFTGKEVRVLSEGVELELSEVLHEGDEEEKLRKLMDPLLGGKYNSKIALFLLELIDNCIKNDPSDRPNMDEICRSLSRISTSMVSGDWTNSFLEK